MDYLVQEPPSTNKNLQVTIILPIKIVIYISISNSPLSAYNLARISGTLLNWVADIRVLSVQGSSPDSDFGIWTYIIKRRHILRFYFY